MRKDTCQGQGIKEDREHCTYRLLGFILIKKMYWVQIKQEKDFACMRKDKLFLKIADMRIENRINPIRDNKIYQIRIYQKAHNGLRKQPKFHIG